MADSRLKGLIAHLTHPSRRMWTVLGAVGAVVVLALVIPLLLMSRPAYFAERLGYTENYEALQTSAHSGMSCTQCHGRSGQEVVEAAAATGDFYRSLFPGYEEPLFVELEKPTRDACVECHETDWTYNTESITRIPHPAHLAVRTEMRDCVGCHKWTAHQEKEIKNHQTMPFSGVCTSYGCHVGWKQPDTCANCHHSLEPKPGDFKKAHPDIVFASGDGGCLESCHEVKQCQQCHTTGVSPDFGPTNTDAGLKEIETLHVRVSWISQHGSKALEDQSKCLRCHISTGKCDSCHEQRPASHGQGDTWIGQHKTANAKPPHCLTCHEQVWCDDCHDQFEEMR
jgi:hypothetical protein